MAGPTVAVRILGDLKSFGQSLQNVGSQAQSVAGRASSAFGSMLSGLNSTGALGPLGGMLDQLNNAFASLVKNAKQIGPALIGAGAGVTALGAGLSQFGSKEQAAQQQLKVAIDNTGNSYDDYAKSIEEAISHNEKFGKTSHETQNALQTLTQATHDPQKALDLLSEATDLAAAKHMDLNDAAAALGKVYNGNTKLLKQFGIVVDKNTGLTKDGQTATEALAGVLKGQAAAASDTFAGRLDALKAKITDSISQFGQQWGPAIQSAGIALMTLGTIATATGLELGALVSPITLVVLAVAAAYLAVVALYAKWDEVWAWIGNLPWYAKAAVLILALTNPVTLLILVVTTLAVYWSDIWGRIVSVVQWASDRTTQVVGALAGSFIWVRDTIGNAVSDVVGFFTGLPGRISGAVAGMWDGIVDAFRNALNGVIDLWNRLHIPSFTIGGWSTPLGDLPGWDTPQINFPHIPHLAAGGIITRSGLVYAHAGEAITPARSGPAVTIENAHFASEVDVDVFMRRVAWASQTSRV